MCLCVCVCVGVCVCVCVLCYQELNGVHLAGRDQAAGRSEYACTHKRLLAMRGGGGREKESR